MSVAMETVEHTQLQTGSFNLSSKNPALPFFFFFIILFFLHVTVSFISAQGDAGVCFNTYLLQRRASPAQGSFHSMHCSAGMPQGSILGLLSGPLQLPYFYLTITVPGEPDGLLCADRCLVFSLDSLELLFLPDLFQHLSIAPDNPAVTTPPTLDKWLQVLFSNTAEAPGYLPSTYTLISVYCNPNIQVIFLYSHYQHFLNAHSTHIKHNMYT